MEDNKKQIVAHFSNSAKINSILERFSEKQLSCQQLKQCVLKKLKSSFYMLWCN